MENNLNINCCSYPEDIPVMYPPRWEDLKEATEDPNVTALLEELCHSAALGNPLVEANEALENLELDQETNMAAARKSLKDVLEDRAGYASGFRRKENINSFPSSCLTHFYFAGIFSRGGRVWCQRCKVLLAKYGAFPCGSVLCEPCVVQRAGAYYCPVHTGVCIKLTEIKDKHIRNNYDFWSQS